MAKVTVLMNCLNGEVYVQKAIESVLSQTFHDFKILFVDNCSEDRTAELVQSFRDQRIIYQKTPQTVPLYAAREFGLSHIDSEWTCFLDVDDFWLPRKLEQQIQIEQETRASLIYTNFKINLIGMDFFKYLKAQFYYQRKYLKRSRIPSGERSLMDLLHRYDINLQTVMIRTQALRDLHFNPKLNWFGDADVFLRHAKQSGSKIYYSDLVTSYSSVHSKQLSRASQKNNSEEVLSLMNSSYQKIFSPEEISHFHHFLET